MRKGWRYSKMLWKTSFVAIFIIKVKINKDLMKWSKQKENNNIKNS